MYSKLYLSRQGSVEYIWPPGGIPPLHTSPLWPLLQALQLPEGPGRPGINIYMFPVPAAPPQDTDSMSSISGLTDYSETRDSSSLADSGISSSASSSSLQQGQGQAKRGLQDFLSLGRGLIQRSSLQVRLLPSCSTFFPFWLFMTGWPFGFFGFVASLLYGFLSYCLLPPIRRWSG